MNLSRRPSFAFALTLVLLLVGCGSPKVLGSKADLDKLTQRQGMGHFYYIGTEGGFHYFAAKYFTERVKFYKLPAAEYSFQNSFPKTRDQSKWVPYLFDLSTNTKGFRGEPQETLQATNSVGSQTPP